MDPIRFLDNISSGSVSLTLKEDGGSLGSITISRNDISIDIRSARRLYRYAKIFGGAPQLHHDGESGDEEGRQAIKEISALMEIHGKTLRLKYRGYEVLELGKESKPGLVGKVMKKVVVDAPPELDRVINIILSKFKV